MAQAWRLAHPTERTLSSYDVLEEAVLQEANTWNDGPEAGVALDALGTAFLVGSDLEDLLEDGPPEQRPPPQQPRANPPHGQGTGSTSVPRWAALAYSSATFPEACENPTVQLPLVQSSQDRTVQPPALHVRPAPPAPPQQGHIPDASSHHGSGKTVASRQYSTSSPESITLQRLQDAAGGRSLLPGRAIGCPTASAATVEMRPALLLLSSSQQQQHQPRLQQQGPKQSEAESDLQYRALLLKYWRLQAQLHQKQQATAAAARPRSHSRPVGMDAEGLVSRSSGLEQQHSWQRAGQPPLPALPLSQPAAVVDDQGQLDRSISAPAGIPVALATDASVLPPKRRMSAPNAAAFSQQAGQLWQRQEEQVHQQLHQPRQPASIGVPAPGWKQARYLGPGVPFPNDPAVTEQEQEGVDAAEEEGEGAPAAWPGPWHRRSSASRQGNHPAKSSQAHSLPLPGSQLPSGPMTRPGSSGPGYKWADGYTHEGPTALQPAAGGTLPVHAMTAAVGVGEVADPQAGTRQQPPGLPTSQASMDPGGRKEHRNAFRETLSKRDAFRERERERARRSRQKRQEHLKHLEQQNSQLRREVRRLQQILRAWATQGFVTPEQAQEFLSQLAAPQAHGPGQD
ncbi:hypothetical protein N2152v2_002039 [Parachlorella kessleri]